MLIAAVLQLLLAAPSPEEAFLRERLAPCGFGGQAREPESIYEPALAAMARRVDELGAPLHVSYDDHGIRDCGSAPERPINKLTTVRRADGRVTIIADTGTVAMNNRAKQTYILVQTRDGPRIHDAIIRKTTLRAALEARLNELLADETDKQQAIAFVEKMVAGASVKAFLHQHGRTQVTAKLPDGTARAFIIAKGPSLWDELRNGISTRVARADESTLRAALPMSDAEAVAFVRSELQQFIKPVKGHETRIATPLLELMAIDGQLTDGVPYVNGDIVCGCQDSGQFSIESVEAVGRDSPLVRVTADFHVFQEPTHARHQTFVIVKTEGGPAIYDVIDKDGSLRAQLTKAVAEGYGIATP